MPSKTTIPSNGTAIGPVSNDAEPDIMAGAPYIAQVEIEGVSSILFHRWSVEAVESKATAAKGSKAKKTDNIESYVWRLPNGNLGLPGEYLRQAIINAAKYRQDPRSPRKSAMDLYKAGVVSLTEVADFGVNTWDFLDQRRVTIQRAGITRVRPALMAGWKASFEFSCLLPENIPPSTLQDVLVQAGRLVGLADFRPTFGRFNVTNFHIWQG